jgi:hypothetical protein
MMSRLLREQMGKTLVVGNPTSADEKAAFMRRALAPRPAPMPMVILANGAAETAKAFKDMGDAAKQATHAALLHAPSTPGSCQLEVCFCRQNTGDYDAECPNFRPAEVAT